METESHRDEGGEAEAVVDTPQVDIPPKRKRKS